MGSKNKRLLLKGISRGKRFTLVVGTKKVYEGSAAQNGSIWVGEEMKRVVVGQKFLVRINDSEDEVVLKPI